MKIRKYLYAGKFNRWAVPDYASLLDIKFEPPLTLVGSPVLLGLNTINKQTPSLALSVASKGGSVLALKFLGDLSGKFSSSIFGDETDLSRNLGSIFSSGLSSAGNTVFDNVIKGDSFFKGVSQNVGQSVKGAGVGLGANLVGQGITSLGGNSMLSRGIGQGVATGLGEIGGSLLGKGSINPINLGLNVVGSGLSAAFGPSKEYGGKYGNLTKGLDTAYDAVRAVAPPWLSAAMTMNKGLSNLFGSTSGMTRQDAFLGSAFMPAPVKWLNMVGANTTNTFKNLSWQNDERALSFAGNAFGNLFDKFDRAKEEAGKTYGTFSGRAYREARDNIDFANVAWEKLLNMVDLDELQRIRSLYMTSINNLRYAQDIQGGFTPLYRGKQGMKILNNATDHKVGMRLLSGAALIDDKQLILSFQGGGKPMRPRNKPHAKGEKPVYTEEEKRLQAEWDAHLEEVRKLRAEKIAKRTESNVKAAEKFNLQANLVLTTMNQQANETPFTGLEYQQAAENLRQEKIEKFHEAEKVGEAALMADLAVSAAPFLLRGFRWAFNKAGLLVKVPKMAYSAEVKSPYYKIGQDGNLTFDTQNVVSEIKAGKLDFINEMLSPEYAEAAIRNMEESEKMGLSYTPVFEKAGFKSLREDGIIPKFIQDSKHTWHARTGFMGGTPGKATEIEYNISLPTNIRHSTAHESGHISTWGMGESKSEYEFMKHKANQIFKDNGDVGVYEFGSQTGEAATNMRDLGKQMGITQKTPYPGYEEALKRLKEAEVTSNKGGIVKVLKLTKEAMPHIWRALQGLHFEYAIPLTTAATLYNKSK